MSFDQTENIYFQWRTTSSLKWLWKEHLEFYQNKPKNLTIEKTMHDYKQQRNHENIKSRLAGILYLGFTCRGFKYNAKELGFKNLGRKNIYQFN